MTNTLLSVGSPLTRAGGAAYTVGNYLASRFEDIGLRHYFMVPGDYNLVLLDQLLSNQQVKQIGCCNELNAAYAAEGHARVNGVGAVVTTFSVGAFSAFNGVAGAYAESLPVIFVSAATTRMIQVRTISCITRSAHTISPINMRRSGS